MASNAAARLQVLGLLNKQINSADTQRNKERRLNRELSEQVLGQRQKEEEDRMAMYGSDLAFRKNSEAQKYHYMSKLADQQASMARSNLEFKRDLAGQGFQLGRERTETDKDKY